MSWFDAAGFANIAKSALKEAQRTIDKALDIKEDDPSIVPANTPVDPNNEDFFSNWGLVQSGTVKDTKRTIPSEGAKESKMTSSLWGSFAGSFFDSGKSSESKIANSLEDSGEGNEQFSKSKLVVQTSEDNIQQSLTSDNDLSTSTQKSDSIVDSTSVNLVSSSKEVLAIESNSAKKSQQASAVNSSESVDIISYSTECTTSPESDVIQSIGQSLSASSSALGLKPMSDSVEVLGDSLTSPSSVEVIDSNATSPPQSRYTDEFVSPLDSPSPWSEDKSSSSIEKISPESLEVIPDMDENSIADDSMSYTSVSEGTCTTVLDSAFNTFAASQRILKEPTNRSESVDSSEKSFALGEAITRAPSRSTMHLPLAQVSQILIDTQPQSSKDVPQLLLKTNIIDIPLESDVTTSTESSQLELSMDDGSHSDKTLIGSDNVMESSSDTSTTTETSSHSAYLKNMLADAMTEKPVVSMAEPKLSDFKNPATAPTDANKNNMLESVSASQIDLLPRENSPISSESRSDLVKIGSDHTSGHTSGDELETTTSSDIEIISSPNGDSSSTQSRQSPAKQTTSKPKSDDSAIDSLLYKMTLKKAKGHTRELSEASSMSDDSHSSEVDRLLKRISEMAEILESREAKIIDMNRRNAEVQVMNDNLKLQLDSILSKQLEVADLSQVTEEYTQRLSALEKKFQQAIREKDVLRKQLEQSKQDAATRISKSELDSLVAEKDDIIKQLRDEGEKLSKQQLQHSNIIKKLRAKEKENESTIKHLRESIESLSVESDRLKKSLSAKEEVERTQIEAVYQLTNKNKKLEAEVNKLKNQLDDLTQKYETVKKSFDAAKKELQEKNKISSELQMREQIMETLANQKKMTESQNEEILNQLEDLRYKLRQSEEEFTKKEQQYRDKNGLLLRKLEEAEAKNEELSQTVLEVSKPLVRQLESLQATHTMKMSVFEKLEEELNAKISELQTKLQNSISTERATKDECIELRTKLADIEGLYRIAQHKLDMAQVQVEQLTAEKLMMEQEMNSKVGNLKEMISKKEEVISDQENKISKLQKELTAAKSARETESQQNEAFQSQAKEKTEPLPPEGSSPRTETNSPTLSLGKASVSDSMASSFWSQVSCHRISIKTHFINKV
nr:unnamed protein product [Callosobruchus analis]